jgi:DNA-3-methyladenine glycosylase II
MRRIEDETDIAEGLRHLAAADPRLAAVIAAAGTVPLRRRPGGLEGLARIIVGQQLSIASAEAIWGRFAAAFPNPEAAVLLAASDADLKAPGLSAPKIRTLRAAAAAVGEGLDLDALAALPPEEAHRRLTTVKGIGPWTADIYLLFCLGHADIFPAGDLALRLAVADGLALETVPSVAALATLAEPWSPWRGVAARLFWAYYRERRARAALPV